MRISGEERRAIAKKLRYTANDDLGGLSLQKNLAAITKAEDGSWRGVMRRLADLIDRPTCDVRMGVTGHIGVCTRCGAMVEMRAAVFDAIEALPTRYCPNCGAEVIPHAERRD